MLEKTQKRNNMIKVSLFQQKKFMSRFKYTSSYINAY